MLRRRFKLIKQGLDDGAVLDDLNDVATSSATSGQTIVWNGTSWVPGSLGDIAGTLSLDSTDISDFTEAAQDAVGSGVTSGTGITFAYSDVAGTFTVSLNHLGIQSLVDPNADRILFWDDSAGGTAWLTVGSNLSITGTTISATSGGTSTPGATFGDGNATASVATGLTGYIRVPYSGTISRWEIVADTSCTATVDVWKAAGAVPTVANKISATDPPQLSAATVNNGTALTGWTTSVSVGDVFGFYLTLTSGTPKQITVVLAVT